MTIPFGVWSAATELDKGKRFWAVGVEVYPFGFF
jgi:hypothetical protein